TPWHLGESNFRLSFTPARAGRMSHMATLLESLTTLVTPATGQIAERLGESQDAVTSALPSTFASVLGGLVTKTADPGSFRQVFDLITSRPAGATLPAAA